MREKASYRATLDLLKEMYPGKLLISIPQAAKALGCDPRTLRKEAGLPTTKIGEKDFVNITVLANFLSF